MTAVFGVDIGGSGIKGAPVDLARGALTQERYKVLTPQPSEPELSPTGMYSMKRTSTTGARSG